MQASATRPRAARPAPAAGPPRAALPLLALALAGAAAASLLLPLAVAHTIDALLAGRPAGLDLLALAAVIALGAVAAATGEIAAASGAAGATARDRRALLGAVLTLGVGGSRRFAAGDLISRLVGNCADSGQAAVSVVTATAALATSAGAAVALWLIDPWLGAVFFLSLVPILLLVRMFVRQFSDLSARYQAVQGQICARLADALGGVRTIRASGTAEREIARILQPLPELSGIGRQTWSRQRSVVWRLMLIAPVVEIAVLGTAGYLVAQGHIPLGDLLAAAGYTTLAIGMLDQIDALAELGRARSGTARVREVRTAADARPIGGARPLPAGAGSLALRGVTVRAGDDGEHVLLDQIDLDVAAGCTVALVGPSGSGKSTLAHLLGRLVDPDEGTVLLDGTSVAEIDPGQLNGAVAYAFERPALLGDTVHDAIAYAEPALTRAQTARAAELASADPFIRHLPQGYDTPVRELTLSGGEIQRLGLARALAQDARVLVLDDATSSLDTVTEMHISRALTGALAGRTRVVVAQRAVTASRADAVAWLEEGRLRAVAPHADLWHDPEYRAVFNRREAE